jgi:plasmid maintenance system antidote protein VapI
MKKSKAEVATQSDRLKALLRELKLTRRGAARILEMNERTIRRYCAGSSSIPRAVFIALESLKKIARAEWPAGEKVRSAKKRTI